MLLIRGEKRCLAHTQILAAPGIKAVLSNATFINVFMFLTPPRHAAGYGHERGHSMYFGTPMEVCILRAVHMRIHSLPSPLPSCVCTNVFSVCVCVCTLAAQWSPW